ncbi:TPA: hypothetical protein ACTA1Y_000294 [Salmonella enterica subsp. enterica serovar Bovismorbificans]|jgi:hypothetical protein|nr:hypothetical protein [Salmonella enterica subsp. enterica serovar Enteritidis]HAU7316402.1 hypothetical protein [Salmonella enterica subsp. enterica serovar Wangata]HAU7790723.1 hypothetical protein [Salmonella enterica subsp. enterica serovar Wangata]HAU7803401.1 hypothetical protein [Salmonella enterica subsp. enterica serovar Wangata]
MAFSWTKDRIGYLRENAGKLSTREMAEELGTNVTVIRNMAARLKLSLRVRGFTHEHVEEIHKLYASPENITIRNIAIQTGLSPGIVSYILYSAREKTSSCYERVEYIEFETTNGRKVRVEKTLVDTTRTPPEILLGDKEVYDIWLQDGTRFKARNLHISEQITVRKTRGRRLV